ncbi:MAG: DUF4388 domain-containing protein [Thermoanaerobaculia bacterium]
MAISGSLRTMQFSELLQWLSTGQKAGTLIVRGSPGEKRIYFQNGRIVSSSSTVEREFLGRFLVGFGFITEEELLRALQVQQESKVLLGKILVMIGAIREEELADLLRLKAAETIYDIFLWEDGTFAFLDGEVPNLATVTISSEVTGIVMEGLRRFDEWQRIRTRLTSLRQVPAILIPVEEGLNDREKMILNAIDGIRPVEEIAAITHNPDFHVAKFVYDLLESGHLQLTGEREPARTAPERLEAELQAEMLSTGPISSIYSHEPGLPEPAEMSPSGVRAAVSEIPSAAAPPQPLPSSQEDFRRFLRPHDSDSRAKRPAAARSPAPPPPEAPEPEILPADTELPDAVEAADSLPPVPVDALAMPPKIPLAAVPRLTKPMEELTSLSFTPNEAFIVSRINGIWDIRSIARISPFPEAEVSRVFAKLEAEGVVTFR